MSRVPRTARFPLAMTSLLALGIFAARTPADEPKPKDVADVAPPETFSPEQRSHWAYQIAKRPDLPKVKEAGWVRNPVDQFILAELEAVELAHSAEADKVALIRRVTFDLTGLPPTVAQVDAYLADARPDAYDRLVDRLLDCPQHGERWAQHWLDLAHYADTNGFELDAERPDAWRYRDWVVNALNADMPYDRFLTLQLAGDEAAPGDRQALIATGFGRCGPREVVGGNIDPEVRRQSEMTEVTGTVGSVFLGLTLGCARCHDHKFDALPTTDYYRLQSFFAAAQMVDRPIADAAETEAFAAASKAAEAKIAPLRKAMAELEAPYRKAIKATKDATLTVDERKALDTPEKDRTPEQKKTVAGLASSLNIQWPEVAEAVAKVPADHAERERLKREIDAIQQSLPRPPAGAMALADAGKEAPDTFVYRRGEAKSKGPKVAPRPPGIVLASLPAGSFPGEIAAGEKTTGRRKALAAWMSRPDNPLTARVIVNRLWMHHFGHGIVATPSDFGVRGEAPSHPELLDWLATELVSNGWHLKPLHKLMVTSATYRQSSAGDPGRAKLDPENTTLWRMNRRRLEAESLRDAMLAVTGELNPKLGGPGVLVPIEREVEDLIFTEAEVVDLWPETPDPAEHARRSLYLYRKRNVRYPMFDAFDAPDTQTACPQRATSTHALQSLVMLNSDFALSRAAALAGRLYREGQSADDRIRLAYRAVLAREPRPAEIDQARAFLASQAERLYGRDPGKLARPDFVPPETPAVAAAAWVDFALAMLNRNEFVYIP
jgi:hypothetical protein